MTNFVFDTCKTSAPSENQRTSILTSYFFQHGRDSWHMVGKNTLAQRRFLTLGNVGYMTLRQRSCGDGDHGDVVPT